MTAGSGSVEHVRAKLAALDIRVTAAEAARLSQFVDLLQHWNRVHNLIGASDRDGIIERHLAESLALESLVAGAAVADVGSGGGLPGVPLAIRLPGVRFTLIESRRKRASFLRQVATSLGLGNVEVFHGRAEAAPRAAFPTVVARAVAPPPDLIALLEPLATLPDGRLVLLTGEHKARDLIAGADGFVDVPVDDPGGRLKSRIVVLERRGAVS